MCFIFSLASCFYFLVHQSFLIKPVTTNEISTQGLIPHFLSFLLPLPPIKGPGRLPLSILEPAGSSWKLQVLQVDPEEPRLEQPGGSGPCGRCRPGRNGKYPILLLLACGFGIFSSFKNGKSFKTADVSCQILANKRHIFHFLLCLCEVVLPYFLDSTLSGVE